VSDHENAAVVIRSAGPADHPGIRGLADRLVEGAAPWRPVEGFSAAARGWLETSLAGQDGDHPVWVAELDGTVVGVATASLQEHFTGQLDSYLGELAVDQRYLRRGVGRQLVAGVEVWALHRGVARVRLDSGAANASGRAFYAALGYREEQVQLTHVLDQDES
jgi:GNAT superfamily N-acetyltransferase